MRATVLILCWMVFGFETFAACAEGADSCNDVIECDAVTGKCDDGQLFAGDDAPDGEVICSCSADYGTVAQPVKQGSDDYEDYIASCAARAGKWDQNTGSGPRLDDCKNGRCKCYRTYDVRVPAYGKIDVRSGSTHSKELLRKLVAIADETCKAVSAGQPKKYKNIRCLYYSGYHDRRENVSHDYPACVIRQGSGKNVFDQWGEDNICYI